MPSPNDQIDFGYYLTAFVDLLGQSEAMASFGTHLPKDDPEERQRFVDAARKVLGPLFGFRDSFDKFFDGYANRDRIFSLTEEQKTSYAQMGSNSIRQQKFSDGLLLTLSLRDGNNKCHMRGVTGVLYSCGAMFLLWLSEGYPMRAGIDVDIAAEIVKDEVYGPAVANAYKLENTVAQYPRIVVGDGVINYINAMKVNDAKDVFAETNRAMAASAESMICVDIDGQHIVDYLGNAFRSRFTELNQIQYAFKAYDFVLAQSSKWQTQRHSTLAFRYSLLREYFEARLPEWRR